MPSARTKLARNLARLIVTAMLAIFPTASSWAQDGAGKQVGAQFIGTAVDDLFIAYGPPLPEPYTMSDGRKLYRWGESSGDLYCQVSIVAAQGRIQKIVVQRESIGWWNLSRCAEFFNKKR